MSKKNSSSATKAASETSAVNTPPAGEEGESTASRIKNATGPERQLRVVMVGPNNKILAETKTLKTKQPDDKKGNALVLNFQRRQLMNANSKLIAEAGGLEHVKFEIRTPRAEEVAATA